MSDPDWCHHCGDSWRRHVLQSVGLDICDIVGASPRRPKDWVAMMRRLGVRDMSGVIAAVHGQSIPSRLARRSDIVRKGWAIGVCRGDLAEFYAGDTVSMSAIDEAWELNAASISQRLRGP